MQKALSLLVALLLAFSILGCSKRDGLYDKAKAEITKDLPFPASYKMEYTRKGKVPHVTSSGFVAVNSDLVYKIKFQTKDKDGVMVHCYAYVMFDNKGQVVRKEILPIEIPVIDELLGITDNKGGK